MISLYNQNILLGVTGGIAAYKAAYLTRALIAAGANVQVVMSTAAKKFIGELTFQALSGRQVFSKLLDADSENAMGHIDLARWADAIIVAPATADFIARLAQGRADDLLSAICLANDSIQALAPAMNHKMWLDVKTKENVDKLKNSGILIFGPADGEQACLETGPGRMLEPDDIIELLAKEFNPGILTGKRILITAGPTREPLDPVRFISNKSSGKMGYALAEAALSMGAKVDLISGPVNLEPPPKATITRVETAEEMLKAVKAKVSCCDWMIGAAAVADYAPVKQKRQKIKKSADKSTIELKPNPDIIGEVGKMRVKPFLVGFAAETADLEQNAKDKLIVKNLDVIVANRVGDNLGTEIDENAVTIFSKGEKKSFKLMRKTALARKILKFLVTITENENRTT